MGVILNELNEILDAKTKVVNTVATDLYNELVSVTPVLTGQLKTSWEIDFLNDGSVIISNNTIYAEIRLSPLIVGDNGKVIQGSKKYPAGIEQIIDRYDRILQRKLNAI